MIRKGKRVHHGYGGIVGCPLGTTVTRMAWMAQELAY